MRMHPSLKRKTPARGAGAPRHPLCLAVGAGISIGGEQPGALAGIRHVEVGRLILSVLGLNLGLPVLRVGRRIRHISLRYDAWKLGEEGIGRSAVTAVCISRADA